MLTNYWPQIEIASVIANFLTKIFLFELFSAVLSLSKHVSLIVSQSKHVIYPHYLFAWHFTKWQTQFNTNVEDTLKFI